MATPRDRDSAGDYPEDLYLIPSGGGYELYRHKSAESIRTKNWHGLYWARQNEEGDYEIRSVPSSLGERSVPGGVLPKEGFEEHYERVDLQ